MPVENVDPLPFYEKALKRFEPRFRRLRGYGGMGIGVEGPQSKRRYYIAVLVNGPLKRTEVVAHVPARIDLKTKYGVDRLKTRVVVTGIPQPDSSKSRVILNKAG